MSKEAVERLARHISQTCACAMGSNAEQPIAGTLRAFSARLAEVEAQNRTLRVAIDANTKKHRSRTEAAEADRDEAISFYGLCYEHCVKLEAERDALQAKLALAVEALGQISNRPYEAIWGEAHEHTEAMRAMEDLADDALAQLTADTPKEGKDDDQ